jgi:hypothetical protein
MDRGYILAAEHAQEIFEDLDAACGVIFERLKVGRYAPLRREVVRVGSRCSLASSIIFSR